MDRGDLQWRGENALVCTSCQATYPVREQIFCLLPIDNAQPREQNHEMKVRDAESEAGNYAHHHYARDVELNAVKNGLHLQEGELFLDAGAGSGDLFIRCLHPGVTHVALDFSFASLVSLRKRIPQEFSENVWTVHGDITRLPFKDQTFHKISSVQVIECLPEEREREKSFREIHRSLKPKGELVFTVHQYSSLLKFVYQNLYHIEYSREGRWTSDLYYYRFGKQELAKILNHCGFEPKIECLKFLPNRMGERFAALCQGLERFLSKIRMADPLGNFLLAKCQRQ